MIDFQFNMYICGKIVLLKGVNMIKLNTSNSREAETLIYENLSKIGRPEKLVHSRSNDPMSYKTTIYGSIDSIEIVGGLSSGYTGTGPNAFVDVLKHLGLIEIDAEEFVFSKHPAEGTFEIDLKEYQEPLFEIKLIIDPIASKSEIDALKVLNHYIMQNPTLSLEKLESRLNNYQFDEYIVGSGGSHIFISRKNSNARIACVQRLYK